MNNFLVAFFSALAVALLVNHIFWEFTYRKEYKKMKLEDIYLKKEK